MYAAPIGNVDCCYLSVSPLILDSSSSASWSDCQHTSTKDIAGQSAKVQLDSCESKKMTPMSSSMLLLTISSTISTSSSTSSSCPTDVPDTVCIANQFGVNQSEVENLNSFFLIIMTLASLCSNMTIDKFCLVTWQGVGGALLTMIDSSHHHIETSFIAFFWPGPWYMFYSQTKVAEVVRSLGEVGKTSAWLKAIFQPNRTLLVIDMQVNSMRMAVIAMIITFGVMMMVMMIL